MKLKGLPVLLALTLLGPFVGTVAGEPAAATVADARIVFPASVQQGALVIGKVPAGYSIRYRERTLRATP